jgi:hypothetical protein
MRQEYKILLFGLLSILLVDVLGSIASRQLDFNASILSRLSFIIYGTFGFITTKKSGLKTGVLIAAIIGLFDSTIGWKISMLLNANTGNINNDPTAGLWLITIAIVTGVAALFGLIGGGITMIKKRI